MTKTKEFIEAQKEAAEACQLALTTVDGVDKVTLSSYQEVENTLPIIAELRTKREHIDGIRKRWTGGLKAVIDDINSEFKPGIEAYKAAEDHLKNCVATFTQSQLDHRDELLSSVQAAPPEERGAIITSTEELVPPKLPGLSLRETWKGKVTDTDVLLAWILKNKRYDLLNIDEKVLGAITKTAKADPNIPGWTAWRESTAVVTPSKIK